MPNTLNQTDLQTTRLLDLLKQHSFRTGQFTLASGKTSSYYMDGRMTTLSAQGAWLIGELLYHVIAPLNLDAIGGLTLGADPIVSAVTMTSVRYGTPINGFLIRKAAKGHGTGRQIEGHLQPWYRVALVEDVMTTGQSFVQAIEAVQRVSPDIHIAQLLALVDREEGGSEVLAPYHIPIHRIFSIRDFQTTPA